MGTVLRVLGGPGPMTLIEVAPAVSPAHLEEVLILQVDHGPDPRFDAVEPSRPRP